MQHFCQVTMTNVKVLKACWKLLLTVYGFTDESARKLIIKQPFIFSLRVVESTRARLRFLQDVGCPPRSEQSRRLVARFPQILYIGSLAWAYVYATRLTRQASHLNRRHQLSWIVIFLLIQTSISSCKRTRKYWPTRSSWYFSLSSPTIDSNEVI